MPLFQGIFTATKQAYNFCIGYLIGCKILNPAHNLYSSWQIMTEIAPAGKAQRRYILILEITSNLFELPGVPQMLRQYEKHLRLAPHLQYWSK